jgi:hypothetical protein
VSGLTRGSHSCACWRLAAGSEQASESIGAVACPSGDGAEHTELHGGGEKRACGPQQQRWVRTGSKEEQAQA